MRLISNIKLKKRLPYFRAAVFVFIFLWTGILLWGVFPTPGTTADFETIPVSLDDGEWINFHGSPVILKPFRIEIKFPRILRPGENGKINLKIEFLSDQDTLSGRAEDEALSLLELANDYQVMAVTRLELNGLDFTPPGEISRSIVPAGEQTYQFEWNVQNALPGDHTGTLWLYLWLHDPDLDRTYQFPLLARTLQFEVKDWGWLTISKVQWIGVIGLCLNIVIFWVITVTNRRYFMP